MNKIELKFNDKMKELVISGKKTCTTRRTKHGEVGDYFVIDDEHAYVITEITEGTLYDISNMYYSKEGFENPDDFRIAFLKAYNIPIPEISNPFWLLLQMDVWVHCFRRLKLIDMLEKMADIKREETEKIEKFVKGREFV